MEAVQSSGSACASDNLENSFRAHWKNLWLGPFRQCTPGLWLGSLSLLRLAISPRATDALGPLASFDRAKAWAASAVSSASEMEPRCPSWLQGINRKCWHHVLMTKACLLYPSCLQNISIILLLRFHDMQATIALNPWSTFNRLFECQQTRIAFAYRADECFIFWGSQGLEIFLVVNAGVLGDFTWNLFSWEALVIFDHVGALRTLVKQFRAFLSV